jgi:Zn finger protein HypA/HybF involved in hydrogenase expression
MKKLYKGIHKFQESYFKKEEDYFKRISKGQTPEVLFITCSDSRVDPNLVTQSKPGEKKKKLEEEKHKRLAEEEKKRLKELHYMRCPKCGMELIEIDYKGIKVDKCSECEGIWLDVGELEAVSRLEKTGLDKLFSVFKK